MINKIIKNIKENKLFYLILLVVFVFFAFICYCTPLAGDDWDYAYNGMRQNPFLTAYNFYFGWSGRFFSELFGFIVAPNKWLWNIINPLLFTGIIYLSIDLVSQKNKFYAGIIALFCMLFVNDGLRMETYSWIMGTTYVIPLFLLLLYFKLLSYYNIKKEFTRVSFIVTAIINFYIGLTTENAAVILVLANILLAFYSKDNKKVFHKIIILTLISIVSLSLLRLSPGSAYRLSLETEWLKLSLFEQITSNLPNFIQYTFYDNKYLICLLNLLILYKFLQSKNKNIYEICHSIILILTTFMLVSIKISSIVSIEFNIFNSYFTNFFSLSFNLIIWLFYIILLFVFACKYISKKEEFIFYLLLAGAGNLSMLISPIFGARSSLYFYYFSILLVVIIFESIQFDKVSKLALIGVILLCSVGRMYTIVKKYNMVKNAQIERMEIIQYYKDRPEIMDIWIPRFPIYTVHSADIENDDLHHMEVFKRYFGLNENSTIHFYAK